MCHNFHDRARMNKYTPYTQRIKCCVRDPEKYAIPKHKRPDNTNACAGVEPAITSITATS